MKAPRYQRETHLEPLERRDLMSADVAHQDLNRFAPAPDQGGGAWTLTDQISRFGASDVDHVYDQLGLTGLGQTVAIIDSGIAYDHYALGGGLSAGNRVVGGWDFAENDADPYDDAPGGFHGTHVAGIVGSDDPDYRGVASGVDLVALRVFDDQGVGNFDWIKSALAWVHTNQNAFANPITTVNLSIGSNWNSHEIPGWATLEDELSQLKQDGIFIAVSAGNQFRDSQLVGLNYPAASPFVVPVASGNQFGTLSDFSQRNQRVLVAPGESITSTAPDYLYGFDGVTDDFLTSSGTSMAAPYVAGASVLVRQAWELTGRSNISQDAIYDHLLATADPIYDAQTRQTYSRLNLMRALDAALPADEFADTATMATKLGTISESFEFDGMFQSRSDVDYVSFVAGRSGTIRVETTSLDFAAAEAWVVGDTVPPRPELEFRVTAGQSYTIGFQSPAGIGRFQASIQWNAPEIDLGVVDTTTFTASPTSMYAIQAAHSGWFTVTATGGNDGHIELLSPSGQQLAKSTFASGQARLNIRVEASDALQLRIAGATFDPSIRMTNVVSFQNGHFDLHATSSHDRFIVRAGREVIISVHGETYTLPLASGSIGQIHNADANDEVWLFGSDGNDVAEIRESTTHIRGPGYALSLQGARKFSLMGQAGNDQVTLYDSAADDVFVGRREFAIMTGGGFRHSVRGFESIEARSTEGNDRAIVHDGAGDDRIQIQNDRSIIDYEPIPEKDELASRIVMADFQRLEARSRSGGTDTAEFRDSAGDDRLIASPDRTRMEGDGYLQTADGFHHIVAFGGGGGNDSALLTDSPGNDQLQIRSDRVMLRGTSFSIEIHDYDRVAAQANQGGIDSAVFRDSAGDDRFIGFGHLALMDGSGYRHTAFGFDQVTAFALLGNNSAVLYADSSGRNALNERGDLRTIRGSNYATAIVGFDHVSVVGETVAESNPQGQSWAGGWTVDRGAMENHIVIPPPLPAGVSKRISFAPPVMHVTGDAALRARLCGVDGGSHAVATHFGRESEPPTKFDAGNQLVDADVDRAWSEGARPRGQSPAIDELAKRRHADDATSPDSQNASAAQAFALRSLTL